MSVLQSRIRDKQFSSKDSHQLLKQEVKKKKKLPPLGNQLPFYKEVRIIKNTEIKLIKTRSEIAGKNTEYVFFIVCDRSLRATYFGFELR